MFTSTTTGRLAIWQDGVAPAIKTIAEAGFDCFDYSVFAMKPENPLFQDGWEDYVKTLKATAEECGIVCNQCHAPFPSYKPAEEADSPYNSEITDALIRTVRAAAMLGAKQIIVHPISAFPFLTREQYWKDLNMDFYRSLAPYAKEAGIRIALENMFHKDPNRNVILPSSCGDPRVFADWYDTLAADFDCFTCCLDIGHCALVSIDPAFAIRTLGHDRLGALHTHDNGFLVDDHMPPFTGKLDWNSITDALAEIDYKGDLTLESDRLLGKFATPDLYVPGIRLMSAIARHLADEVDAKRGKQ